MINNKAYTMWIFCGILLIAFFAASSVRYLNTKYETQLFDNDKMPPEFYRKGAAYATTFFLNTEQVQELCDKGVKEKGNVAFACSGAQNDRKVIILPNPCPYGAKGERYAELVCHEVAHVKGWRH